MRAGGLEDQLSVFATSNIIRRPENAAVVISGSDDEDQSDLDSSVPVSSVDREDEGDIITSVEAMALQDEHQASYIAQDDIEWTMD